MNNSQPQGPEAPEQSEPGPKKTPRHSFPIVGIGASAGGLAAFELFFSHLPAGSENELAFVLVQHLSPDHKSLLADLVQRFTHITVVTAEDGVDVQKGHAYVIPPNQDLSISQGKLRLTQPITTHGLRLPIDFFFRSLAEDQGELAVGIILSGTGTDGTQGLKSIKEAGGLVIVQAPETADYDGMPRSALATHLVDFVSAPDQMPGRLLEYAQRAFRPGLSLIAGDGDQARDILEDIFHLLLDRTGIDFSRYKISMTTRRVERRMAVHLIRNMKDYLALVQQSPAEVDALFNDLLIGVTSFFRNPEAFEVLKEKVIPQILIGRKEPETVRVWVPGCSTGEEAYSLAILFREFLDQQKQKLRVQIFGTDIDSKAIARARSGVYPENIALDLSAERLDRFFLHEENIYLVRKNIRDMVIFAEHNLIESPPFTKLDLISCRNLLIYLSARIQKKLIPLFRYALQDEGFLFLGNAEGVGAYRDIFSTVDRKWKLYRSKGGSASRNLRFDFTEPSTSRTAVTPLRGEENLKPKMGGRALVEKFLLKEYAPACVVIDEKLDILYIHGHTGLYLEPAQGEASANLLRMIRPGLRTPLAALIRKSAAEKAPARLNGLNFKTDQEKHTVNLAVYPIDRPETMQGLQFVVFQQADQDDATAAQPGSGDTGSAHESWDQEMEREIWAKEDYFQAIVEELESANQELKSNNEEMQAMNEELQSANEELETAKEELQSVNEELNTVNTELQSKLDELSLASNDMKNLLTTTEIATLFLDTHLKILRYTPAATRIIKLIPGDVGRPVSDIVTNLKYDDLLQNSQEVLDTLVPKEEEVQARKGAWYLLRILPYRTLENIIEGVVITFVDITEQKQTQSELKTLAQKVQEEREFADNILATVREPLVVLNQRLEVISANRSFYQFFQVGPAETIGFPFPEISQQRWDIPKLLKLLHEIQVENNSIEDYPVEVELKNEGKQRLRLNARKLIREAGKEHLILLAFENGASSVPGGHPSSTDRPAKG